MARRHIGKKLTLSAALLASAGAFLGVGSFAAWTATTTNPTTFAAGTLTMTNSDGCPVATNNGTCTAILNATNLKPTQSVTGTVTIVNTGSLAGTYTLSPGAATPAPSGATICSTMTLTVTDDASPANTLYNNVALSSLTAKALGNFAASGGQHTYTFTATLPGSSTNSDQGASCSIPFSWTSVPS